MFDQWVKKFKEAGLLIEAVAGVSGKIDGITFDSRELKNAPSAERWVFFARRGATRDGHEFLAEISNFPHVVVFVVERIPEGFHPKVPVIVVRDTALAMAIAAKDFYGDPTAKAFSVAVTGTNGKTTSTFLIQSLLLKSGRRPVRQGTIETDFEKLRIPSDLTTPDFTVLQKLFSELQAKGADAFVFEASSHALDQRRLLGLEIDAALFTNLTPEHLDYHKNMENYFQAKRKLFFDLLSGSAKKRKIAIIPEDGAYGTRLAEEVRHLKDVDVFTWSYEGMSNETRLVIEKWTTSLSGSEAVVSGIGQKSLKIQSRLIGQYNIENLVGMLCLGLALRLDPQLIQKSLDDQIPVRGRLEGVQIPCGSAFVDYAHTPDALENVLMTLRPLTHGKLRVVFGCGGDRDRLKRPQMGAIAELYADEIYVTSDNPRTEDPETIIQEILNGVQKIKPTHIEVDRKAAITKSLEGLQKNDVVLVAGKGHEDYQILGTTKIPFDDREVIREAIEGGKGK